MTKVNRVPSFNPEDVEITNPEPLPVPVDGQAIRACRNDYLIMMGKRDYIPEVHAWHMRHMLAQCALCRVMHGHGMKLRPRFKCDDMDSRFELRIGSTCIRVVWDQYKIYRLGVLGMRERDLSHRKRMLAFFGWPRGMYRDGQNMQLNATEYKMEFFGFLKEEWLWGFNVHHILDKDRKHYGGRFDSNVGLFRALPRYYAMFPGDKGFPS